MPSSRSYRGPTSATDSVVPRSYVEKRAKWITPPLWAFRKRFGNRHREPVNVVMIGSSSTFGTGATDEALDGLTGQVNRLLSSQFIGRGQGAHHSLITHNGWTRAGTWANVNNDFAKNSMSLSTATSSKFTKTFANCTGFSVYYKQGSTATSVFGVKIDAGSIVNVTPNTTSAGSSSYDAVYQVTGLTRGSHTIEISWVSGTGTAEIGGVYVHDENESTGIRVFNCGVAGAVTNDLTILNTAARTMYDRVSTLDPALVTIMLSTNDFTNQVALATFNTNVRSIITAVKLGARRPCSILLVHPYTVYTATGSETLTMPMYLAELQTIANDTADVDLLDVSKHFPTGRSSDDDELIASDSIHMRDNGHAIMAQAIVDYISGRLIEDTIPTSVGAAVGDPDPSTLTNLQSAWRAASLTQTEGLVVQNWATYAGAQANTLTQATSGQRPILRLNKLGGYAALEFRSSASQLMTCAALTCGLPATVVFVGRFHRIYGNLFQTATATYSAWNLNGGYVMNMASGSGANAYPMIVGQSRWAVYVAVYNNTTVKMHQSGYALQTGSISSVANMGFANLWLASRNDATNPANVDIVDFMIYNKAMSDSEAEGVIRYFARKYGIDRVGRNGV